VLVQPDVTIRMSRDPTDDKFLECAGSGGADYVVSADADLLSLREVQGIPILDAPTFWRRLADPRLG
jgi:predicted nucleic acid-binding protein